MEGLFTRLYWETLVRRLYCRIVGGHSYWPMVEDRAGYLAGKRVAWYPGQCSVCGDDPSATGKPWRSRYSFAQMAEMVADGRLSVCVRSGQQS